MMTTPETMTRKDFAARHGRSRMAVSKWERRGLLVISAGMVAVLSSEANMRGAGIQSAILGDEPLTPDAPELREFLADLAAGNYATQTAADRVKANALAGIRVLEWRERDGALVDRAAAETVFFEAARAYRDALMAWSGSAAPTIAADLSIGDVSAVARVLGEHIRRFLIELGEPAAAALGGKGGDGG
jgi:hypothetical protein